jgi:hypothetical protein
MCLRSRLRAVMLSLFASMSFLSFMSLFATSSHADDVSTRTFQESQDVFANPERGWIVHRFTHDLWGLNSLRGSPERVSLVLLKVDLSAYRSHTHLDSAKLNEISRALNEIRAQGLKALIRPAYAWDELLAPDPADINLMRNHVLDMKPLFHQYKDVILAVEMGLFGPWGEMHSSSHSTRSDAFYYPVSTSALRIIHAAYMEALPADRMVLLRRPYYIRELFGDSPLSDAQAYNGSAIARTGFFNDGYLNSADDAGTFAHGWTRTQELAYVATMSRHSFFGGETFGTPNGTYNNANNAYKESRQQHMTYLHRDYTKAVYDAWGTAMKDNFTRQLGYRYVLRSATHSVQAPPGGALSLELAVQNVGFSSLHNPRPVELVLDNGVQQLRTSISVDPRDWNPENGIIRFQRWFHLPANLPEGNWRVYLALPDPAADLRTDGRYAVRFGNIETWDSRGLNLVISELSISHSAPGDRDTDTRFREFGSNEEFNAVTPVVDTTPVVKKPPKKSPR